VIPAVFALYIGLEESARELTSFQLTLIPGLLQTADYRRAGNLGVGTAKPVRQRWSACRYDHQATRNGYIATTSPFRRWCVNLRCVTRSVAQRSWADSSGTSTMSVRCPACPSVWFRSAEVMHVGLQVGSFSLLEFPRSPDRLPVRTSGGVRGRYTGAIYLERETEVRQYRQGLAGINRVALNEAESRNLNG